jgi:nucleotide-binding universal stress UspA family protein
MKPTKILWPTDFSKNSEKAMPYIKKLSQDSDTEIHVLYVIEDIPHHEPWYGEFSQNHRRLYSNRLGQTAQKRLNQICDKYMDGCPLFIRHTAIGDPASEILKLIRKIGRAHV